MQENTDKIIIQFNDTAAALFASLFNRFKETIRTVDRQRHENSFQQIQGKFIYTFKLQLENIAGQIIETNRSHHQIDRVKRELKDRISNFLAEFTRKARSL